MLWNKNFSFFDEEQLRIVRLFEWFQLFSDIICIGIRIYKTPAKGLKFPLVLNPETPEKYFWALSHLQ